MIGITSLFMFVFGIIGVLSALLVVLVLVGILAVLFCKKVIRDQEDRE